MSSMDPKTITRNALGRNAVIGDLFDIRTDKFLDISMLNDSPADEILQVKKISAPNVTWIEEETIQGKFKNLGIEQGLNVSILSDLIPLEGYAKYFRQGKRIHNHEQMSIAFTNTNQVDELLLDKDKVERLISVDAIGLDSATHFVSGISWGTKIIITLEQPNSDDTSIMRKNLTALISSIQGIGQELDDDNSQINYYIFADVLPSVDLPVTLRETEIYAKKSLKLMQMSNRNKGKPLTYTLTPLTALNDYMIPSISVEKQNIFSLEDSTIDVCIGRFDDIRDALLQLQGIVSRFEGNSICIPAEQVREGLDLKSKFGNHERIIKGQLKKLVPAVRSGTKPVTCLDELFCTSNFDLLIDEMNSWVNQQNIWMKKVEFVEQITKRGVEYVGNGTSFEDIKQRMRDSSQKAYVLFFGVKLTENNEDYWNGVRNYFLQLLDNGNQSFVIVDLDCNQEVGSFTKIRLSLYRSGKCVDLDAYATYRTEMSKCLAKGQKHITCKKPPKNVVLHLKCPGALRGKCDDIEYPWHCVDCNEQLSFGFDDHFYCLCGKANCGKFLFKCCSLEHDFGFVQFSPRDLKQLIAEIPPMNELNILVLGVTGVGKSTWLNAFANYVMYPTLKEASQKKLHSVTSSWFQLTDENNKVHDVQFGEDDNEVHGSGSSTQKTRGHLFAIGNTLLRLIDTPGIGDTAGVENDKKNFQNILAYLSTLKEIHCICILLKPNESKLHILFEFCIKELLTYLHQSALKNIVFCFTHSRITFYKPGDTRVPLRELLEQNKINLPLEPNIMYCMDNESFRFLCAKNHGVSFDESVESTFSGSWDVTVQEINRLLAYIATLEPHVISDTISLNDARKNIICLTKPIADISANIQRNLTQTEWKREEMMDKTARVDELLQRLYVDVTTLISEPLDYPRTVCGSAKCVKYHKMESSTSNSIEYKTICHENCTLKGIPVEIVGDRRLRGCEAMGCGRSLFCRTCKCSWDEHLHIRCVQRAEIVRRTVQHVEDEMYQKKSEGERIADFISELEDFKKELEDEQQIIIEASVKFGGYLSKNAIVPYNNVIEQYINHLIQRENDKVSVTKNDGLLKRLKAMQDMYRVEEAALKEAMAQPNAEELDVVEFKKLLDKLYKLKHNGKQLEDAFKQASASEEITCEQWEYFHEPTTRQGYGQNFSNHFYAQSYSSTNKRVYTHQQVVARIGTFEKAAFSVSQSMTWIKRKFWK